MRHGLQSCASVRLCTSLLKGLLQQEQHLLAHQLAQRLAAAGAASTSAPACSKICGIIIIIVLKCTHLLKRLLEQERVQAGIQLLPCSAQPPEAGVAVGSQAGVAVGSQTAAATATLHGRTRVRKLRANC